MKIDCAWFQEELSAYERGGLTAEERESVRQHLTACSVCPQIVKADHAILSALDNLPTVIASADFARKTSARVRVEAPVARATAKARWTLVGRAVWAAPLAAALLGSAGLYWYFNARMDRDRDVIAELDTLEQIDILGSDLALENSASALDVLSRGGAVAPLLTAADEEGL